MSDVLIRHVNTDYPKRIHFACDGVKLFTTNNIWYPWSKTVASRGARKVMEVDVCDKIVG